MASIKIIFRAASPYDNEGTLYYRIIQKRKVRQLHTGNRLLRSEWDDKKCSVLIDGDGPRMQYLQGVQNKLTVKLERLRYIVASLDHNGKDYSAQDVVRLFYDSDTIVGFISFSQKLIEENKNIGNLSAAEHYIATINSFIRFYGKEEVSFDRFDSNLMSGYEKYLKRLGLTPNTSSYYMRKLRTIYNQAVEREYTLQRNPFRHVYTGMAKTGKRAVSLDIIKSLRSLDLSHDPVSEMVRDMFLFSFYTRGMAFVDMAYLRKSDLKNDTLSYRRRKTGQQLSMRWDDRMQEIVARYAIAGSEFLLPIIKPDGGEKRRQYQNASHLINRRLKILGKRLGMAEPLTMYRARHAWASIARDHSIPISVISQGMGHDSERTTRIYLASLDASIVDKANNEILNLLD